MTPSPKWLTLSQAAALLGVHPTTVRRWADSGQLPSLRTPGGHRRFSEAELRTFSQQRARLRTLGGLEHLWANEALEKARFSLQNLQSDEGWMASYGPEERELMRLLGRRTLGVMVEYALHPDRRQELLQEAHDLAWSYAEGARRKGLSLVDALQIVLFFRGIVLDAAFQLPDQVQLRPESARGLMHELNTVLNALELGVAECYQPTNSLSAAHT